MDIVILSTADWDHPFWTNKQHVAVALAELGHRVFYIDSMGIRRPTSTGGDLRRILQRLRLSCMPPRRVRQRIWVWSPLVIPAARHPFPKKINRILLMAGLSLWLSLLRFRKDLLWTYSPLCLDYLCLSKFSKSVYHCVDAIDAQPEMPADQLISGEQSLCRAVDYIFTTSRYLQNRCSALNSNTYYFSNVADDKHFRSALDDCTRIPADLLAIPKPRIGFVGAISPYKLDFALIRKLAVIRPNLHFVLIGAIGEGQPGCSHDLLMGVSNLHILGPRPYGDLPGYLKGFDIGIIPAPINIYTQAMFPMKFFEYLSAGLPVVSTRLDSLLEYSSLSNLCDPNAESFSFAIDRVLATNHIRSDTPISSLGKNYISRTMDMLAKIANDDHKS